jgi:hypothetical protein
MKATTRLLIFVPAAAVALAVMPTSAGQRETPPPGVPVQSSSSRPVSPTVVATTMTRTIDGNSSLDLMVLWRGTPEWYLKPGARSAGGGGSFGSQSVRQARLEFGGVALRAELQSQPRVVRIQGADVSLTVPDANVILVDEVEGPNLKVTSTLKVDALSKDRDILPWLKQAPQVVSFLQCETQVSAPAKVLVDPICQALIQK